MHVNFNDNNTELKGSSRVYCACDAWKDGWVIVSFTHLLRHALNHTMYANMTELVKSQEKVSDVTSNKL